MTDTIKLIDSIRKVYDEKGLTIGKVEQLFIEKGKEGAVAHTTIGRFFSKDKRDEYNFRYEDTIRPLAELLLDVDTIENTDDTETQAMKSFVQVKRNRIEELELALTKEKKKRHDIIDKYEHDILKLREQHELDTKLLREQLAYKDKRMDQFIDAMFTKDKKIDDLITQNQELSNKLINCSNCKKGNVK